MARTGPEQAATIIAELKGWAAEGWPVGGRALALTGPAGAGKTFVATQALAACAGAGMLTGSGKFVQGEGGATFAPVMAALTEAVGAAMRTLFDRQRGLASLTDALGVQLDVLFAAGFELADVVPARSIAALADRRGSAARITAAVLALLDWLTRFGAPRVLLIDDWYRAGEDMRHLLAAMIAAPAATPLLLVLTQRDARVEPLADRAVDRVHAVEPLDAAGVRRLLDLRLGAEAGALAAAVLSRAEVAPLPFDVLQAADALVERQVLRRTADRWEVDGERLRSLALDAATRIGGLEERVFAVALALALWGDRAPLAPFRAAFADGASIDRALAELRAREIVATIGPNVAFRHDRLRRETLVRGEGEPARTAAVQLAEGLARRGDEGEAGAVALHLRLAGGLESADAAAWRDRFARGATAARNRGDAAADTFAEAVLSLHARAPATDRAALRLILREALIAAANRDDPATDARARALISTAATPTETYADFEVGIVGLRLAGRADEAWALAGEGLRRAGLRPPPPRPGLRALIAAVRWKYLPRRHGGLEPGEETDAFTGMAAAAAHLAYHRDPRGTAIIGFDASRRSGRTFRQSPYWHSVDAFLHAAVGDRRAAADTAERAIAGIETQRVYRAATIYQATFFGLHWRHPIATQRPRYLEIIDTAHIEGDLVTAAYAWRIHVMSGWRSGVPLSQLGDEAQAARRALVDLGEDTFVAEMDAMVATVEGLCGRTDWNADAWRTDIPTRNHVIDLELSNLGGGWEETVHRAEALRPLWRDYSIQSDAVAWSFHEALARLRTGRRPRRSTIRLLKEAAALNPVDHRGKVLLIEVERRRSAGARGDALRALYEAAAEAMERSGSRLDTGLALVCAAEAMDAAGDPGTAGRFRRRAAATWSGWGLRAELQPAASSAAMRDQLIEANARADAADRADRAKSRLLAHVGHELRTPLQTLQAAVDLSLQRQEPLDLGDMRLVLGSLTRLVDDLDVIGRLDGAAVTDVDLAALIRSEIALVRRHAVAFSASGDPAKVVVAADRVRQIVRNLLSNACKYGGDGAIEVRLEQRREDGGVRARIVVADRGRGVPEALRERIFEPFDRGERAKEAQGAGLGLALSRELARRLGGGLTLEERTGGGAAFVLDLQLPVEAAPIPAATIAGGSCHDILLIEDAAPVRRLLSTVLSGTGYRVREAATAAEGLAAWRAEPPDLTVVDLGLPDASGLEVLAEIRRRSRGAAVILLSAAITGEASAAAAGDPRVRALRKPASAESLAAKIAELFGASAPPAASPADPATDPLYAAARDEVRAAARAALTDRAAATPQALHRLAGTAAQFGWLPVAQAVEEFALALASGAGTTSAQAKVLAAIDAMSGMGL